MLRLFFSESTFTKTIKKPRKQIVARRRSTKNIGSHLVKVHEISRKLATSPLKRCVLQEAFYMMLEPGKLWKTPTMHSRFFLVLEKVDMCYSLHQTQSLLQAVLLLASYTVS